MARAKGANAVAALAFETDYGTPPDSGWIKVPFSSSQLGEQNQLIASDLLGFGREMQDPIEDVVNNTGDVVVPVDARNFGYWLKLAFGDPTTVATTSAAGFIKFSAQPVATSTVTINGVVWTFVASGAAGDQVAIGATLALTMTALAAALNASSDAGVTPCTYTGTATQLNVVHDAMGPAGNAFTLAADATSNGVVSGATLSGGYNSHTFVSGAAALPSASIEIGLPDVPSYGMNFGCKLDKMKISMARSGLLSATCSLIAQGETLATVTGTAGGLTTLETERFAQATGSVDRNDVALAGVVSTDFTFANDLEAIEVIRSDGRIDGADEGQAGMTGNTTVRFADTTLLDQATSGDPCVLTPAWSRPDGMSLSFTVHRVFLPKPKRPVTGPKGVQVQFAWQASTDPDLGKSATVVLVNDVASYA